MVEAVSETNVIFTCGETDFCFSDEIDIILTGRRDWCYFISEEIDVIFTSVMRLMLSSRLKRLTLF